MFHSRSIHRRGLVLGAVLAALAALAGSAVAATLEERVDELDQKVRALQKQNDVVPSAQFDGFGIKSADGAFGIKFHALLQTDAREFVDDKAGNETNSFLLRRVRPWIEATLYKDYDLVVVPDFANNASTALQDAYLDAHPWSAARLRVGKQKPPIGFEHMQSDPYTTFPERSFVSALLPSRDTGFQIYGDFAQSSYGYALSATNGVGDNNATGDVDSNDGKEGTARLWTKPFKNTALGPLQNLHLGLGASYANQNVAAPTYRTSGQVTIFTPVAAATPDGEKFRLAPELAWSYRGWSLIGEWAESSQVYKVGTTRSRVVNQAWEASAGYVLTGEDANFPGIKPRKPFDPAQHQWGAWQLVGRYHALYLDPDNFDRGITTAASSIQRASAYTIGVNWFLNNVLRVYSIFENTSFDKGAAIGDRPNEKLMLTRVQVNF